MSGVEKLARVLFEWNTPTDPYFVIKGRVGDVDERDPYIPIVEALLADPGPLLAALAEAGVLHVEDTAPFTDPNGDTGHVGFGLIAPKPHRRYVTAWEATDARP